VRRFTRAIVVASLLSCAVYAQQQSSPGDGGATTAAIESSREILLTFEDRGLVRTTNTGPGHYFRRGSAYQGTSWSRSLAADIARDYPVNTVLEWPIRALGVHCVVYRVGDAQSVDSVIARLRGDTRVKSVQRMNTFRALAGEDPYKPLQTSFNEMQVEAVHRWATGAGIRIAIIDTGVDVNHPDLEGQVAEQIDLTGSGLNFEDDIHGTAVAGIIGALSENGLGIEGVAPDARLLALRACWPERSGAIAAVCNSLTLARALDNAILLKAGIVNLSLTGPPDQLIGDLLKVALLDGIIIVAAEPDRASPPGFIDGIDGIIRVSSRGGQEDPVKAGWGRTDTIMAPGSDLLTTFPRGTYSFASGSSFAAANVSGIIALLLELQPGLSSQRIEKLLLMEMGEPTTGETRAVSKGFNVCRVAAQLRPEFVCADADPSNLLVQKSSVENFGL
jgi:hypothetical protein